MSESAAISPARSAHAIDAVLRAAGARLSAVSASPRLDAELLLSTVLGCSRAQLRTRDAQQISAQQARDFEALLARRAEGEPVAYLLGEKEFWSLPFKVTPAVLVPRPETELLVEWALQALAKIKAPAIADLGTGSGAIALALAHERPGARVHAVDASAAALAVARANAAALNLAHVDFRQGDWFAPLAGLRFNLVISNPPYVAAGDPHLRTLRHEPEPALVAGADGLEAIRRIVVDASAHLAQDGWLLLEHGADQGAAVRALLAAQGFVSIETRRDLAGLERASGARRGSV